MKKLGDDDQHGGLSPLTIAVALGASVGVWLVIGFLRGVL